MRIRNRLGWRAPSLATWPLWAASVAVGAVAGVMAHGWLGVLVGVLTRLALHGLAWGGRRPSQAHAPTSRT